MAENTKEVAEKKEKTSYFKSLKAEFKKIIWPDKKKAMRSTVAVIVVSLCVGVLVAVLDTVIKFGLGFIL